MSHAPKIVFLIAAVAAITACGGSDSEGSNGQINASESPAPTIVTNDGEVVARAVFVGGVQSSNTAPIKSTAAESLEPAVQRMVVDMVVSKVSQKWSLAKTITTSTNAQNTAGSIKFVDEKVAVGNGQVTLNGEFSAEKSDDLHIKGTGTFSAWQEGLSVSVLLDGATYSELVDGTATFEMSLAVTYTQNASGQYNGYKMSADVIIKGSDIKVTGDVPGSVLNMDAKYHYETVNDVNGTALVSESCGGYLSVEVNGEQAVCGVLSSCDGCEQPGL